MQTGVFLFIFKLMAEKGYKPTQAMKTAAQRALNWRSEFGRGGTAVGIARARDIVNGASLSKSTVMRMFSFFSRHEIDKKAQGFREGEEGFPSNGRIAWDLWGGDAGFSWSKKIKRQLDNEAMRKILKPPKSIITNEGEVIRSINFQESGYTEYVLLGFPYTGHMKGGLDFHGTRFTPETDFGWTDREFPVYFSHAKFKPIGPKVIGKARLGEETEMGRLIHIIIEEANEYHNLIAELNKMGLLRGSGQAIATCYETDGENIRTFHLAEYSLTVTPSNNLAVPIDQIKQVFRSYNLDYEGNEMEELMRKFSPEEQEMMKALPEEVQKAIGEMEDDEKRKAKLYSEFKKLNKKEESKRHVDELKEILEVQEPEVDTDALELADVIRSMAQELNEMTQVIRALQDEIADLKEGQKVTVEAMARNYRRVAAEARTMPNEEAQILSRPSNGSKYGLRHPFGG